MDDIEIVALVPNVTNNTAMSVDEALENLLHSSPGWPLSVAAGSPLRLTTFDVPKLPAATKALGAVYWVSTDAIKRAPKTLHTHAECLLLQPLVVPGQWSKKIKAYYEHPTRTDVVGVPRFWGLSMFGPPDKDIRTLGGALSSQPQMSLRPLQERAVKSTLATLDLWGGATITADCGFGKTRLAVALASALGRKVLVLCNRDVLMEQWADVMRDLAPGWTLSWLQGSPFDKKTVKVGSRVYLGPSEPADVCLASITTLIGGTVPKEILAAFGTVIVDECHHLAAATLVHALPLCPARYVIGLSATPDRRDGLEHALYWLAGPSSFVYKRLPAITGQYGSVQIRHVKTLGCNNQEKIYEHTGQLAFAEMLTMLTRDVRRNKYILDTLCECLGTEGRKKIIVVSGNVEHCVTLHDAMVAKFPSASSTVASSVSMAIVAGKTVQTVLAKDPNTRLVFATYSMLEEGYDDPLLDTLILATPRSRIQQTIGRVERSHEGKLQPLVVDLVDTFSIYPNMWRKRETFYKSRGFDIVYED